MVSIKEVTEMFGKDVFTNKGYYLGELKDIDIDISTFRIRALVIETSPNTEMGRLLGGKRVIVPYSVVQAVGDVVITKHIVASTPQEGEVSKEEVQKA
ncbi:MAG: PRC-barrel domain-containing protein [Candidatus Aenigmarchaeota archaeon]|nr:PRC-barrel domain-containing protein [Candidatus Aenigmarchaeota archaeon]MCX8190855.1 PRC-barrel domain-containing protein [Candidatus Aenigmarchaeota archaeon]MDW8159857.1 PRC-barrel domain-containing protein [Candidatus Aenigmarchaeota archaeon]